VTVYRPHPEGEAIARRLIPQDHPHLDGVEMRFILRDEHQVRNGKTVYASTRLIGGREAWLAAGMPDDGEEVDRFFVLEFAEDVWRLLEEGQRTALVDHELCHCGLKLDGTLTLLGHDLEEFVAVVGRHGMWRPEVENLVRAAQAQQLSLEGVT
jgi:Putative phage metallopeptidase